MGRQKKTYLDMFLDNAENSIKIKKEIYFGVEEEQAILKYNDTDTSETERSYLFSKIIDKAFKETVAGVLKMPQYRRLPKSMDREQLIDETYFRLIEKINKFTPGKIGKNGDPVKAYSYFSTVAKNYILEKKIRHEKILKNKADVESSIDLSILSEDTLKMMSNYDKMDIDFEDYQTTYNNTKSIAISAINELIKNEENKNKQDNNFIKIGYTLIYLLEKWNKIEFMKKNEFMRILTMYAQLPQQQVSFQFKKYKTAVFKKIKPWDNPKLRYAKVTIESDDILDDDISDDDIIDDDIIDDKDKLPDRFKYGVKTMEEFEMYSELEANDKFKLARKKSI